MGRNHPLVESLAEHLFDLAFHPAGDDGPVSRCGVIHTDAVDTWTTLLLLRLRYLQHEESPRGGSPPAPGLAEETLAWGYRGLVPDVEPLTPAEALALLDGAAPAANVAQAQKLEVLREVLGSWQQLMPHLDALLDRRAAELTEGHQRLRAQLHGDGRRGAGVRITPHRPPDLLGAVVLMPVPRGVKGEGVR